MGGANERIGIICVLEHDVTSRVDHYCSVLVGLPFGLIGRLDLVLRSAAHLIGHLPKYAPVSAYMRDVLHWLPASQRISYQVATLLWRCFLICASSYLSDFCQPVSDLQGLLHRGKEADCFQFVQGGVPALMKWTLL